MKNLFYQLAADTLGSISTATVDPPIFRKRHLDESRTPVTFAAPATSRSEQPASSYDHSSSKNEDHGFRCDVNRLDDSPTSATVIPGTIHRKTSVHGILKLAHPFDALSAAVCAAIVGCLLALVI